ncbi:hypothetical protein PG995_012158 [Apiospora arundinis]
MKLGDIFGSTTAGVVVKVGPQASGRLRVGDRVFGWAFQEPRYKAHQEYVTAPEWMFGKIPENISSEEAATIPENLITIFNTLATDLALPTPGLSRRTTCQTTPTTPSWSGAPGPRSASPPCRSCAGTATATSSPRHLRPTTSIFAA